MLAGKARRFASVAATLVVTGVLAAPALAGHNGSPPGRTYDATTGNDNGATVQHENQYHCMYMSVPGDPSPSGAPIGWPWVGASPSGQGYNC